MVYGSVSTGFRSDGAQPRPFTPGQQRVPVPAEELIAYEIGVKTDLFDRRLRLNVAAFMDDYDPRDIRGQSRTQCNLPSNLDPGPVFRGITAGNTLSCGDAARRLDRHSVDPYDSAPGEDRGVEVELTASPDQQPNINATLAWFDFKSNVAPHAGERRSRTPATCIRASTCRRSSREALARSIVSRWARARWLRASTGSSRAAGATATQYLQQLPGSANKVPGFGLVNARISYVAGGWQVGSGAVGRQPVRQVLLVHARAGAQHDHWSRSWTTAPAVQARGREFALTFRRNFQ